MLNFVTVNGDAWVPRAGTQAKKAKPEKIKFHKGFRVVGLPPGSMDEARKKHELEQLGKKEPKPFSEQGWLMNAHAKPVRSKPYEIKESADQCAELAEKNGWMRVQVVELKSE